MRFARAALSVGRVELELARAFLPTVSGKGEAGRARARRKDFRKVGMAGMIFEERISLVLAEVKILHFMRGLVADPVNCQTQSEKENISTNALSALQDTMTSLTFVYSTTRSASRRCGEDRSMHA